MNAGAGRWELRAPWGDAKTAPPLAVADCWYWFVVVLGACFLFGKKRRRE